MDTIRIMPMAATVDTMLPGHRGITDSAALTPVHMAFIPIRITDRIIRSRAASPRRHRLRRLRHRLRASFKKTEPR